MRKKTWRLVSTTAEPLPNCKLPWWFASARFNEGDVIECLVCQQQWTWKWDEGYERWIRGSGVDEED